MRISDWSSDVCSSDLTIECAVVGVWPQPHRRGLLHQPFRDRLRDQFAVCVAAHLRRDAELELQVMMRSEEHTSELQSLMRISYAVFCLKKKKITTRKSNKQLHIIHSLIEHLITQ